MEREGVARDQLKARIVAERSGQVGNQVLVAFDGDNVPRPEQQLGGQDAETRSDFEHGIVRADPGLAHHPLHDTALIEEVLAQPLARSNAKLADQRRPVATGCR